MKNERCLRCHKGMGKGISYDYMKFMIFCVHCIMSMRWYHAFKTFWKVWDLLQITNIIKNKLYNLIFSKFCWLLCLSIKFALCVFKQYDMTSIRPATSLIYQRMSLYTYILCISEIQRRSTRSSVIENIPRPVARKGMTTSTFISLDVTF